MYRVSAALTSGVLFYFSLGLTPVWWAAWLAPIPILLAAFYSKGWRASAGLTYLAVGIGISSNFKYYLTTTGAWATPVLLLLQVLVWGFFVTRTRSAVRSSGSWTVVFVYPLLVTGASALVSLLSPHGTWGSYVYTQMDNLPAIQIASVLGPAGVMFLLGLFASVIAVAIYRRGKINRLWLAYGLPVLLLATGIGFGFARLQLAPQQPLTRIGVASIDDFIGHGTPNKSAAVWDGYAATVSSLAKSGARIVVLPEKVAALSDADAGFRRKELSELAERNGIYLVAGLQLNHSDEKDNTLWLFGPSDGLMAEYHKQHLVPHLEADLAPGHEDMVRQIDGRRFGLAICRDLLFASPAQEYGRLGVSVLLVPAWDFYVDAWMASSVADLRGVENGYSIVRAGRESYLNVSDRYGRLTGRKRSDFLPGASLLVDLPLGPAQPTLYSRFGNWFGYLAIFGMVVTLVPRSGTRVLEARA